MRWSRKPAQPPPSAPPVITDKFAVVPCIPERVDRKYDSAGHLHLRIVLPPQGLAQRIADWVGYDYSHKLELDEQGTYFFAQIDGTTPLATIVTRMAQEYAWTDDQARERVILFTKKMMVLNMLVLLVDEK
jgi:hypothetical protein